MNAGSSWRHRGGPGAQRDVHPATGTSKGTRTLRWRAVTALLAAIFALPSCFTAGLWQSVPTGTVVHRECGQSVLLDPPDDTHTERLVVHLSAEQLAWLHELCPEVAADLPWLLIEPEARFGSLRGYEQGDVVTLHVLALPGRPLTTCLFWHITELNIWFTTAYRIETERPCRLASLEAPPGTSKPSTGTQVCIVHERIDESSSPLAVKVLATPFAVAADAACTALVFAPIVLVVLAIW
jgi:hypothetical protein